MARTASPPTTAPFPSEGGSYLLDEKTGRLQLLDRTQPASPKWAAAQDAPPVIEAPASDPPADTPTA